MTPTRLRHALGRGIGEDDWSLFVSTADFAPFNAPQCGVGVGYDGAIFDVLLEALDDPGMAAATRSGHLFSQLQLDWDTLSEEQQQVLLPRLARLLTTTRCGVANAYILELLSEYYGNAAALNALISVAKHDERLAHYGLERFAMKAADRALVERAREALRHLPGRADGGSRAAGPELPPLPAARLARAEVLAELLSILERGAAEQDADIRYRAVHPCVWRGPGWE